jgi:hypothetical protein
MFNKENILLTKFQKLDADGQDKVLDFLDQVCEN